MVTRNILNFPRRNGNAGYGLQCVIRKNGVVDPILAPSVALAGQAGSARHRRGEEGRDRPSKPRVSISRLTIELYKAKESLVINMGKKNAN